MLIKARYCPPSPCGINSPAAQNVVAGVGAAFSAGVFVALNLLGAGGGRPDSAHVVQIANAILSSVWFFSGCVGGTYLNLLGPGITMSFGICTYALYVGSLWYYEISGLQPFPLAAGAVIGVGAGAVWTTSGYIQIAYSSEGNKGKFIAIQNTLQAVGSVACSILPVVLNRDNKARAGVPAAIYIIFIIVMLCAALLSLLALRRAHELEHSIEPSISQREKSITEELRGNFSVFRQWKFLLMIPAFFPAGSFLVYLGSVNVFQNSLRARSLCSFVSLIVQIPIGHILQVILDHRDWTKRRRGLTGLTFVGMPLSVAWVWEIVRTRSFDRTRPQQHPIDWAEPAFGPVMMLFVLNWTASMLWQYLVPWFVGALSTSPARLSYYMGVQRGFLAAGEAVCFGIDSIKVPYATFASCIFGFYAVGIAVLTYLGAYHLDTSGPTPTVVGDVVSSASLSSLEEGAEKGGTDDVQK